MAEEIRLDVPPKLCMAVIAVVFTCAEVVVFLSQKTLMYKLLLYKYLFVIPILHCTNLATTLPD